MHYDNVVMETWACMLVTYVFTVANNFGYVDPGMPIRYT